MRLIKFFIFVQLFLISLFADVKLNINEKITSGEAMIFSIEASGEEIKFPNLSTIDGNIVHEISSSMATTVINGNISKVIKKSFSFIPTKDFIFPSLEFEIDGKVYKTDEKRITLQKASKTKSDIFDLTIKTNKDRFYVGENFILTITFKHKKDIQIVGLSLNKPNFDNFWYKQIDGTTRYEEKDFEVIELKFLMSALKEGHFSIEPMLLQVQVIDNSFKSFFSSTKDINVYSNELNFDVKNLPKNIKLVGNFEIESTVDKANIKEGEAVSYKIKISGKGNFDDIPDIKFALDDVTIYENKPEINSFISENEYQGSYEKVFSIVANKSFTVPSITFEYFDKEKEKIITKSTKSFDINVEKNSDKKEIFLEKIEDNKILENKEVIIERISSKDKVIFFIFGMVFTILIFSIYLYINRYKNIKKEKITPLNKKVKNSQSKVELIKILVPYFKVNSKLDELIFSLEKDENDFKTLKNEIQKILKELKL